MKFIRQQNQANSISRYDDHSLTIAGQRYSSPLLVSADELISPWDAGQWSELTLEKLLSPLRSQPEVLLLGCGENYVATPVQLLATFSGAGIGLEVMTTGAACRTYNVLVSEGRNAAAALIFELS